MREGRDARRRRARLAVRQSLLATEKNNTTPFSLESDTAPEFYVTGDPGPNAPQVRTLERDVAGLTANNPYAGGTQKITNYLADPAEEAILHRSSRPTAAPRAPGWTRPTSGRP